MSKLLKYGEFLENVNPALKTATTVLKGVSFFANRMAEKRRLGKLGRQYQDDLSTFTDEIILKDNIYPILKCNMLKYNIIVMGANISEIIIFYTLNKIEAEEYEEKQKQIKLNKQQLQYLEIINPLKKNYNIK